MPTAISIASDQSRPRRGRKSSPNPSLTSRAVQVGTIDALIAQLCIRRGLTLLTTDADFSSIAQHSNLAIWRA